MLQLGVVKKYPGVNACFSVCTVALGPVRLTPTKGALSSVGLEQVADQL
jgi:hypothetical protein